MSDTKLPLRETIIEILGEYESGGYLPNENANPEDAHPFVADAILDALKQSKDDADVREWADRFIGSYDGLTVNRDSLNRDELAKWFEYLLRTTVQAQGEVHEEMDCALRDRIHLLVTCWEPIAESKTSLASAFAAVVGDLNKALGDTLR